MPIAPEVARALEIYLAERAALHGVPSPTAPLFKGPTSSGPATLMAQVSPGRTQDRVACSSIPRPCQAIVGGGAHFVVMALSLETVTTVSASMLATMSPSFTKLMNRF